MFLAKLFHAQNSRCLNSNPAEQSKLDLLHAQNEMGLFVIGRISGGSEENPSLVAKGGGGNGLGNRLVMG